MEQLQLFEIEEKEQIKDIKQLIKHVRKSNAFYAFVIGTDDIYIKIYYYDAAGNFHKKDVEVKMENKKMLQELVKISKEYRASVHPYLQADTMFGFDKDDYIKIVEIADLGAIRIYERKLRK